MRNELRRVSSGESGSVLGTHESRSFRINRHAVVIACLLGCGPAEDRGSSETHATVETIARTAAAPATGLEQVLVSGEARVEGSGTTPSSEIGERKPIRSPFDDVDLATVKIGLERTACYGPCPEYTIEIRGDGDVRYTGASFVLVTGEQHGSVSQEAVRRLLSLFEKYEFLDLKFTCHGSVLDAPSTRIRLKIGDRELALTNHWFGQATGDPEEDEHMSAHLHLQELAHSIDAAVEIEQWIGTSEDRKAAFQHSWSDGRR